MYAAGRGYAGIELYVTRHDGRREEILSHLESQGLRLVAQFSTHGTTATEHLEEFQSQARRLRDWCPDIVVLRIGTDRMAFSDAVALYEGVLMEAERYGLRIAFETHRRRPTFTVTATAALLKAVPEMQLAADLSHWCCVHESLLEDLEADVETCLRRTAHVHARVGHAGGPQVHELGSSETDDACKRHLEWWRRIIAHAHQNGRRIPSFTPEFGPYPYEVVPNPAAYGLPTATDLNESMHGILRRMVQTEQKGA